MNQSNNLFILDESKETIGILSNRMPRSLPYLEDLHERSLDDLTNILTFKVPANHPDAEMITAEKYVLYPSVENGYLLFKIKEVKESRSSSGDYYREVYAEISAQDDLLRGIVRPKTFASATLETVIDYILQDADWYTGSIDDFPVQDYVIDDYMTQLEALVNAVKAYGAELDFEYVTKGSVVYKQRINALEQIGEETGKFFTYGKDVTDVERIEDTSKLITAIIPVGKDDSKGNKLTIVDIGNYDSYGYVHTLGDDWIGSETAADKYSNGEHIFGLHRDDTAQSIQELFSNALKVLKQYSKPLMTYKVGLLLLEKLADFEHMAVQFGDTIVVQDNSVEPDLIVEARIRKMGRSLTDPTRDYVELGDYIPIDPPSNKRIYEIQKLINQKESKWTAAANNVQIMIESTGGDVFHNGTGSSNLKARLFQMGEEVDPNGTLYSYMWYKYDKDGNKDESFGNYGYKTGKTIQVVASEVSVKATFSVEVSLNV